MIVGNFCPKLSHNSILPIIFLCHLLSFEPVLLFADSSTSPRVIALGTRQASRSLVPASKERPPLYFVENRGQVDLRAAYYIHGSDKAFYFGSDGITLVLSHAARASVAASSLSSEQFGQEMTPRSISRTAVRLEFVDANSSVTPVGEDLSPARFSYFKGPRENWTLGLKSYKRLVYPELWPGIDLVYTASADRLKYMFVVKPGADPARIKLRYRGAESVSLDAAGKLRVRTAVVDFHDDKPAAHQEIDGGTVDVSAAYALVKSPADAGFVYGFDLGRYDATKVLVIDPAILVYAGFIGGAGNDSGNSIAVDGAGNSYITGETSSLQSTFPVAGGLDVGQNGGVDAFIAKVDPSGTQLLYAGFIGGTGDDLGKSIAVDSLGNAYITGTTSSNQASFPVIIGPDLTFNGTTDAFVAKINSTGSNLLYAGYIGGLDGDTGMGIALDSFNRAYVTGATASSGSSFPSGAGFGGMNSFDASQNGGVDAFVARVAASGASLEYAGFIGGLGTDGGTSIAVDSLNRAYITGVTESTSASFPTGVGFGGLTSFDSSLNGDSDAFVVRVAADGLSLNYASYIGGSLVDKGNGIVVDGDFNAYVTGETTSDGSSFPDGNGLGVLAGPSTIQRGGLDAFVAKVNTLGNLLLYAGFIGGTADDRGNAIALMPGCVNNCEVYIAGETSSLQASFPVSVGPDLTHNGGVDAFIAEINANGSLGLAGYLGGAGDDRGRGIALDTVGDVYVTGETNSQETTFPVRGLLDRTQNLLVDAFVAKICVTSCTDVAVTKSDSPDPVTVGASVTFTIAVMNNGPDTAHDVEMVDVLPGTVVLGSITPSVGSCTGSTTITCDFGDLANGASATVAIVVTTTASGKLTNTATVSIDETDIDPSNNLAQQQTTVTLPDVTVKRIDAVAAAIPGDTITVEDTTNNKGKVLAGASITKFYLSTDSKFDGSDTLLGSRAIPALAPKESSSGTTPVTIPLTTPLDRFFIIGVADADSGVPETKEKNAKARSLSVTLPDLVVQSLSAPSSAAAGASIVIKDTTSNKAKVGAGASTTQYYLSTDVILGGDVLLGSRSVPALSAKGRSSGEATVTIPLAAAPGRYFLLAVSDGGGAVSEVNENNNLRSRSITVTP